MKEPSITTKIAPDALDQLRLVAHHTGEKQIRALTRLIDAEFKRLGLRAPRARKPREAAE
jgi:hypothetical protein